MQTEIPAGWETRRLGEVAKLIMGQSPPSSLYNEEGRGLPFYQGNAEFGYLHPVAKNWIEKEFKVAEPGDVLVSVRAPVGELNVAAERCVIGRGLAAVRGTQLDRAFTYYLMAERSQRLASLGQGSTFDAINSGDLRGLRVSVPPLPEQKKIAAILASVDEAIQATEAVIEQTRRVKEGLLQDLLTRGIGHTRFKQTRIGEIPEAWEVKRLQEICREKITYGIVQCGPHVDDGVPYVRVSDMLAPELSVSGMLRTDPEIAAKFSRSRVEVGDVIYALRGKIGEVRLVSPSVAGANLTQGTARLSPAASVSPHFLLWVMRSPATMKQGELEAKGSTFKEITLARLRQLRIPVPPLHEQDAIVDRLQSAEASERQSTESLELMQEVKTGLLQDLLTGAVRVAP